MDQDEVRLSLWDWQQALAAMSADMTAMAQAGFPALETVIALVDDAASRIDDVRP